MHYNVFIAGHGSWPGKAGYTQVPKGCTVRFYSEFNKGITPQQGAGIISGQNAIPAVRVLKEYQSLPNMVISTLGQAETDLLGGAFTPGPNQDRLLYIQGAVVYEEDEKNFRLSRVMRRFARAYTGSTFDFHWTACSYPDLYKTPGATAAAVRAQIKTPGARQLVGPSTGAMTDGKFSMPADGLDLH